MLINNKKKILIWQPFKNYSTSLADYMTNYRIFGNGRFLFAQGPVPYLASDVTEPDHEPGLGHTNWLPARCTNYLKLLPIRNPYDRVISQWKNALKDWGNIEFDEWLMTHSKQLIMSPVTKMYKYEKLIKVENIQDELQQLGLWSGEHEFPHNNKSDIQDGFKLNQSQKDIIYYFHYSDFVEGGYEK